MFILRTGAGLFNLNISRMVLKRITIVYDSAVTVNECCFSFGLQFFYFIIPEGKQLSSTIFPVSRLSLF